MSGKPSWQRYLWFVPIRYPLLIVCRVQCYASAGVPLLGVVAGFGMSAFGDAGNWCWIKPEFELLRLIAYYIPLAISLIGCLVRLCVCWLYALISERTSLILCHCRLMKLSRFRVCDVPSMVLAVCFFLAIISIPGNSLFALSRFARSKF